MQKMMIIGGKKGLFLAVGLILLLAVFMDARATRAAAGKTLYFPLVMQGSRAFPLLFPDPAVYEWRLYLQGLSNPVVLTNAGDGSGRLFVVERVGRIRIIKNDVLLATPFLDITNRVGSSGGEQGLLGLAFDPNYASNGRFYVDYTDKNGDTVVSRFNRSAANTDLADSGSESPILSQAQPAANHNGGDLAFGPDGYLYISFGDGGGAGDPNNNGQKLNTFLGKILRINVQGASGYTVPADNPFSGANQKREIWAYGLRNPWRFSFDRMSGDFYIADVGQNKWEELDVQPAGTAGGQNYGWRYREGAHSYQGTPPSGLTLVDPVLEYDHGQGCAITGGYVYRGQALPAWQGIYLFADYCSGRVWAARNQNGEWVGKPLFSTSASITSFGQDEAGELYLLDQSGRILRFVHR